jgi:hypothetical protein
MAEIRLEVVPPAGEIARFNRRLRENEVRLIRLNKETVDRFALLAMAVAKEKALRLPSKPPTDRGTRRRLSAGVGRRKTKHGYRVTTSMPGMSWYPRAIQSQWRHPTFGHRPIVSQVEAWDWFIGPISDLHDDMARAIRDNVDVMDD